jgi:hypothetical protein
MNWRNVETVGRGRTAAVGRLVHLALAAALALAAGGAARAQKKDSCSECHSRLGGKLAEPVEGAASDIHHARGLSCNDCHGGDPAQDDKAAAKDPRKGYQGKPAPGDIPSFCAKCHSDAFLMKKFNPSLRVDQKQEYLTSVHGRRLQAGDQRVATCVSCHGVHGIRGVADPLSPVHPLNVAETCGRCHGDAARMKDYPIPSDQYRKYRASVHAAALYEKQDLSAPTCNDCHGNHGASPPGIASVANVCGQCHVRQADLFRASPHKAVFDRDERGECIRCHNNHDILKPGVHMMGVGRESVCVTCHAEGDEGFAAAGLMRARMDELQKGIDDSAGILGRAERAGMEVSRPKFELREAVDALTHARVLIHGASTAEVEKVAGPGLEVSRKSYKAGQDALAELSYRRKGLAVSLFFILLLAALVYLKVRAIEGREARAPA